MKWSGQWEESIWGFFSLQFFYLYGVTLGDVAKDVGSHDICKESHGLFSLPSHRAT